ncbi:uncharacterized protein BDZ99DRAFT_478107 [Mytilinidion resinicola]|uniref:Uncharacterized protein n=1 Tax=Mytilinidion resinicola TaxID=574789 RepID=A0A6A6YIH1_9PEZI|nr:uncharacterized protein BDZ99DRAFT_478107 [Mytilinidion resinicola]KAF2808646.1 hypothetical protein BDZ99DRAFT_478107 [Mytilinidion resinicola]
MSGNPLQAELASPARMGTWLREKYGPAPDPRSHFEVLEAENEALRGQLRDAKEDLKQWKSYGDSCNRRAGCLKRKLDKLREVQGELRQEALRGDDQEFYQDDNQEDDQASHQEVHQEVRQVVEPTSNETDSQQRIATLEAKVLTLTQNFEILRQQQASHEQHHSTVSPPAQHNPPSFQVTTSQRGYAPTGIDNPHLPIGLSGEQQATGWSLAGDLTTQPSSSQTPFDQHPAVGLPSSPSSTYPNTSLEAEASETSQRRHRKRPRLLAFYPSEVEGYIDDNNCNITLPAAVTHAIAQLIEDGKEKWWFDIPTTSQKYLDSIKGCGKSLYPVGTALRACYHCSVQGRPRVRKVAGQEWAVVPVHEELRGDEAEADEGFWIAGGMYMRQLMIDADLKVRLFGNGKTS